MIKASARNPPRIARRKDVPMNSVTMLAEVDGEKCINLDRYKTRLLALARYARFSNTSAAGVCHVGNLQTCYAYQKQYGNFVKEKND